MMDARIALAALLLSACQPAPEPETANEVDAAAGADIVTLPPDESMAPPEETTENAIEADSDDATRGTIPAAFHGRWGMVPADCTSTRGDAKGLLTIGPDALRFYESRATLTSAVTEDADRLVADYAFVGEGRTWTRRVTLELTGDDILVRSETDPPSRFTYRRCDT